VFLFVFFLFFGKILSFLPIELHSLPGVIPPLLQLIPRAVGSFGTALRKREGGSGPSRLIFLAGLGPVSLMDFPPLRPPSLFPRAFFSAIFLVSRTFRGRTFAFPNHLLLFFFPFLAGSHPLFLLFLREEEGDPFLFFPF